MNDTLILYCFLSSYSRYQIIQLRLKLIIKRGQLNMLAYFNNSVLRRVLGGRGMLISYSFGKIIKLAPTTTQPKHNIDESISKSITSALMLLKPFSSSSSSSSSINPTTTDPKPVQQFIDFITNINIQTFESKIMNPEEKSSEILRRIKTQRILINAVEILIAQKSFTQRQKKYVTNLFCVLSLIFKKSILQGRKGQLDLPLFKQFMQLFNQYMLLISLTSNHKLILNYLFLTNHLIKTKIVDSSRAYFVNQKIVIDHILENKDSIKINSRFELMPMFNYLSLGNVVSNYPQRYYQFVDLLLARLEDRWDQVGVFRNKRFVLALYNLSYRTEKIMNGLKEIMKTEPINQQNYQVTVAALNAYINLKADMYVNGKNCPDEIVDALRRLQSFIKNVKQKSLKPHRPSYNNSSTSKSFNDSDIQLQIYRNLIPTLFRCSIWSQPIWVQFAQWLDHNKNYQKLPIIQIYTIMELLQIDNDLIPPRVKQRLQQSKQHMLVKNNFRIEDVDLIKVYHRQFGQRMRGFYTSQQQIANNLRSVSKINIKTQSLIRFFLVDILMNNDTIIEINNQMHYIMDEGQVGKVPNVKSAFRKRILEKLGYKFMEFEVDTFVEGNYQFLKTVENEFNVHQQLQQQRMVDKL